MKKKIYTCSVGKYFQNGFNDNGIRNGGDF